MMMEHDVGGKFIAKLPSLVLCLWQLREWVVQDMNSCVACTKSLSTVETDQVIQPTNVLESLSYSCSWWKSLCWSTAAYSKTSDRGPSEIGT